MFKNVAFFASYNDARKTPADPRPQIAFAGRSNVGKSSLLNKLSGRHKLAKTSKIPGRTRRIDFFLVDERFYLVDLPGYGYVKAGVEARKKWGQLVENYLRNVDNLKGLVFLLDCRRDPNDDDMQMLEWLKANDVNFIIALTKADKLGRGALCQKNTAIRKLLGVETIPVSSISGVGKNELIKWIDTTVKNQTERS
ncbi:MAG: YihA family ribosome biogenesis GTP-binding protein [candidate division Zixibacteria bacterium]|nr:YihA family ribosome biogenesis GTP-binding protein [candidate division Zixibacteria bacterium]